MKGADFDVGVLQMRSTSANILFVVQPLYIGTSPSAHSVYFSLQELRFGFIDCKFQLWFIARLALT